MCQWLPVVGVDLLQLINMLKDGAELPGHRGEFVVVKLQPCKMGNPLDIISGEGHTRLTYLIVGIWNGFRRVGRCTLPLRRHCTHTRAVEIAPFSSICMRCRLGRNVRRLMPVTLRPTRRRYLALPRRA